MLTLISAAWAQTVVSLSLSLPYTIADRSTDWSQTAWLGRRAAPLSTYGLELELNLLLPPSPYL